MYLRPEMTGKLLRYSIDTLGQKVVKKVPHFVLHSKVQVTIEVALMIGCVP